MEVGSVSSMYLHRDKYIGSCYEILAWWSGIGLDSYYFELKMSAFIGIATGLAGLVLARPLATFKVKIKFHLQKASSNHKH